MSQAAGGRAQTGAKSLEKALRMLALFDERRPLWRASEIGAHLGLPAPTAVRIARTLEAYGYLERTTDRRYRLGGAAAELGRRAASSPDLRSLARPALDWLAAVTDETTVLLVPDLGRRRARCLDRIEATYPLRLSVSVGLTIPIHAGAACKVLLAHAGPQVVADVLAAPLQPVATGTITDPERLERELALVARRGFAIDRAEVADGSWSMAAPIHGPAGAVVAAIGFFSPLVRLTRALERRGEEYVVRSARMAGERLAQPNGGAA